MSRSSRRMGIVFLAAIFVCYLAYLAAFIVRTSFVVDGVRYFCLFDDAMITMRYARNLAHGLGAVWNPGGERVEGYTNPLWMGYMAVLHLLPVPAAKMPLLVQITGALLLLANLAYIGRIAVFVSRHSAGVSIGAVLLTSIYLPLNNWALQGMEVSLTALLVSGGVWQAIRTMRGQQFLPSVYLLLGVGMLVRLDMAVPFMIIWAFLVIADRSNRRRHLLAGATMLILMIGSQTLVRLIYYGDHLPNTYYLKMTGYPILLRISRGAWVLGELVLSMNFLLFALPWVTVLIRRDKYIMLLLCLFSGQLAYSVYVGGDAWEWWGGANRYICTAMPLFFVLFCWAADVLVRSVFEGARLSHDVNMPRIITPSLLFICLLLSALVSFNARKSLNSLKCLVLREPALEVQNNPRMVRLGLLVREVTRPEAKVAVTWAGIIPYYCDRQMIDILGRCDHYVARVSAHRPENRLGLHYFNPGHNKEDYAYSIGRLQPDVVVQLWSPEEAQEYLKADYCEVVLGEFPLYLRRQSPHVLWSRIAQLQARSDSHAPSAE